MAQKSSHHFITSAGVMEVRLLGGVSGVVFLVGVVDMTMVAEVEEGDEGVK